MKSDGDRARSEIGLGGALFGCAFGAYLLYGAYCSFSAARWPAFMPPQLDVVALVFSFISDTTSAYVAGAVAALLGATTLGGTIFLVYLGCQLPSTTR